MKSDSELLLSLYRDARELPTPEFQRTAIQLVRSVLRFESMIWGAGYLTNALDTTSLVPIRATTFEIDPTAIEC